MSNIIAHKLLPRVAGVIFDAVAAYLISCIWSIIEVGLFSTHEILAKLLPGKSARDLFVFFFIYLSFRAICSLFLGVSLGQYLSGLGARGRGWWQLRLLAPVRVMCDFFDPLDLSQFKQRLTATELYLTSQKSAPLFSVIVIMVILTTLLTPPILSSLIKKS